MAKMTANTVTMRRHPATAIAVIVVRGEPTRDRTPFEEPSSKLLYGLPNCCSAPAAILRLPAGEAFMHPPANGKKKKKKKTI